MDKEPRVDKRPNIKRVLVSYNLGSEELNHFYDTPDKAIKFLRGTYMKLDEILTNVKNAVRTNRDYQAEWNTARAEWSFVEGNPDQRYHDADVMMNWPEIRAELEKLDRTNERLRSRSPSEETGGRMHG